VEWLLEAIPKYNPQWKDYPPGQARFHLLSRVRDLLENIKEVNPPNVHAYVEKELKKQNFDARARIIWNRAAQLPAGNSPEAEKLKEELKKLRKEIIAWDQNEYAEGFYDLLMHSVHCINLRRDGLTERDIHIRKFLYPGKEKDTDDYWENI
jgi:hypothetical protein